jgi:phenylpyruvate tautomerase
MVGITLKNQSILLKVSIVYPNKIRYIVCAFHKIKEKGVTMPYCSIRTNVSIERESKQILLKKVSTFIAVLLGKPESYVMISIKPESALIFGGSDQPAAFVRLKSIGLSRDRCTVYSEKIGNFLEQELNVPKDRVYIDFTDLDGKMFGWNGKTF